MRIWSVVLAMVFVLGCALWLLWPGANQLGSNGVDMGRGDAQMPTTRSSLSEVEQATADESARLRGAANEQAPSIRVVYHDGAPAQGVLVSVVPLDDPQPWRFMTHFLVADEGLVVLPESFTGRIRVEVPHLRAAVSGGKGAEGHGVFIIPAEIENGTRKVVLPHGRQVQLAITCEESVDPQGVSIWSVSSPQGSNPLKLGGPRVLPSAPIPFVRTDDGYVVSNIPPEMSLIVIAAEGYSSGPIAARVLAKNSSVPLTSRSFVDWSIRVNAGGEALEGARVTLCSSNQSPELVPAWVKVSDRRGMVELQIQGGSYRALVDAPGFAPQIFELAVSHPVRPMTVNLEVGVSLHGRIQDIVNGSGSSGTVGSLAFGADGNWFGYYHQLVRCDANGDYRIEHLPTGRWLMGARWHHSRWTSVNAFNAVDGDSGQDLVWNPKHAGLKISGLVTGYDGEPAHKWCVQAVEQGSSQEFADKSSITASDGTFTCFVDGLGPYDLIAYDAVTPRRGAVIGRVQGVSGGTQGVRIAAKSRIEHAYITGFMQVAREGAELEIGIMPWAASEIAGVGTTSTKWGPGASFRVGPLGGGAWFLVFKGPLGGQKVVGPLSVEEGQQYDVGAVTFTGKSELRVNPVAGFDGLVRAPMVTVQDSDAYGPLLALTDAPRDGEAWEFELSPGTYVVRAWGQNAALAQQEVTLVAGQLMEISVELAKGRVLDLEAVLVDGLSMREGDRARLGFRNLVQGEEFDRWVPWNSARRSFSAQWGVAPGQYRIFAEVQKYSGEKDIVVGEEDAYRAEIRLAPRR